MSDTYNNRSLAVPAGDRILARILARELPEEGRRASADTTLITCLDEEAEESWASRAYPAPRHEMLDGPPFSSCVCA